MSSTRLSGIWLVLAPVLVVETVLLATSVNNGSEEIARLRTEYARAVVPMNVVRWDVAAKRAADDGFIVLEVVGQVQVASPSGARLTLLQVTYGDHEYGEMFAVMADTLPGQIADHPLPVKSQCLAQLNTCRMLTQ